MYVCMYCLYVWMDGPLLLPHWSVCGSDASPDPMHWKKPCYSLHVHTHKVSHQCENVSGFSGFPGVSRPWRNLQTEDRTALSHIPFFVYCSY